MSWSSNVLSTLSAQHCHACWGVPCPSVPGVGALLTPNSLRHLQKEWQTSCPPCFTFWAQWQIWREAGAIHKVEVFAKNNACSQELGKQSYTAILALETTINFSWSTLSVFNNKRLYGRLKWKISLFFHIFFSFFNEPVKAEKIYTLSSLPL